MECHPKTLWKANAETGFETEQLKTVVALYEQDIVHKGMSNHRLKTMVKKGTGSHFEARNESTLTRCPLPACPSFSSIFAKNFSKTSLAARATVFCLAGVFLAELHLLSIPHPDLLVLQDLSLLFFFIVCYFRPHLQQLLHPSGILGDWFHDSFFSLAKHSAKWNLFGPIFPAFVIQILASSFL